MAHPSPAHWCIPNRTFIPPRQGKDNVQKGSVTMWQHQTKTIRGTETPRKRSKHARPYALALLLGLSLALLTLLPMGNALQGVPLAFARARSTTPTSPQVSSIPAHA